MGLEVVAMVLPLLLLMVVVKMEDRVPFVSADNLLIIKVFDPLADSELFF